MIKKLLGVILNRSVITVLGLVLLLCLVWFGGDQFETIRSHRIEILVGIVVLVGLFLLTQRLLIARSARQMENLLRAQGAQQREDVLPSEQGEIEELEGQFNEALTALKNSKGGRSALYAFPWYIIIGPPGSGKSTLINESNLNLPYMKQGRGEIRGVGGTRNCDWFFTDQAILLDTAGRYMTEMEDREEWLAFLEMIEKGRKHQPINGIMIAISIPEILNSSDAELEKHAENIRNRLDELTKTLKVIVPVYLIFTKCDLLDGFVEFFGGFDKDERSQVWGRTVEPDPSGQKDFVAAFDEGFCELYRSLSAEGAVQLSVDRPARKRQKIYSFPLQFGLARRRLGQLVEAIAQANPYQETAFFRGFYFSSGTQEGVPIDNVTAAIGEALGVTEPGSAGESETRKQCYFVNDFFTKVLFPDQFIARRTAQIEKRRRWGRYGASRGAIGVAALLLVGMVTSLIGNCSVVETSRQRLGDFRDATLLEDGPSALPKFSALVAHLDELEENQGNFWLGFGLSQSWEISEKALTLLEAPLRKRIVEPTAKSLAASIFKTVARWEQSIGVDSDFHPDNAAIEELRDRVFVYDLLTQADIGRNRRADGERVESALRPNFAFLGLDAGAEGVAEKLASLQRFFVDKFVFDQVRNRWHARRDVTVERRSNEILKRVHKASGIYAKLKKDLNPRQLSLVDVFGELAGVFRQSEVTISSIFVVSKNKASYDESATVAVTSAIENRGVAVDQMPAEIKELTGSLRKLYDDECDRQWTTFYSAILPKEFVDLERARVNLDIYWGSETSSPYLSVYEVALDEWPGLVKGEVERAAMKSALKEVEKLVGIVERVPNLNFAGFDAREIKTFATQFAGSKRGLRNATRTLDSAHTTITRNSLLRLWDELASAIQISLQASVNDFWLKNVFPELRLDVYPLDPESGDEASEKDMADFCASDSKWARFCADLDQLRRSVLSGKPLLELTPEFNEFRAYADKIRDTLFDGSEVRIRGRIGLRLARGFGDVHFKFDPDQVFKFSETGGGRLKKFDFDWRLGKYPAGLTGVLTRGGSETFKEFDRTLADQRWGLFRLMAKGRLAIAGGEMQCSWPFGSDLKDPDLTITGTMKVQGRENPFADGFFKKVEVPEKVCPQDDQ